MKELKSIKTALQGIHLTTAEKKQGAREFARFMKHGAVEIEEKPSFYERFFHLSRRFVLTSASVMGVLMLSTGGITYAAESAVPGDLLYPIKTQLNEPVQGFFHFSPEAKMEWQMEQMERRLEEAKVLTNKGQIQGEFKDQLNQKLEGNQNQILNHIKNLRDQGKNEEADAIVENLGLMMSQNQDTVINIEFKPKPPLLGPGIKPEPLIQNPELQELRQEQMKETLEEAPILTPTLPPLPPEGNLDEAAEGETTAEDPENTDDASVQ